MNQFVTFILVLFLSLTAQSADFNFSWKKVNGALGAEYFSNITKRGIITYGGQQLIPI